MPVQDWISMVAAIVAALGAVVILPWWLRGKFATVDLHFSKIDARFDRLEARMAHMEGAFKGLARILSTLIGILVRNQVVKAGDAAALLKETITFEPLLGSVGETATEGNPVTAEEKVRLRNYILMAQRGELFAPHQAEDFLALSKRFGQEKEDEGVWLIEMLAALVYGIYLGGKDG